VESFSFERLVALVVAISATTGAVVAVKGLRTWRQELRGKTEYELSRRLIRACYKVRDSFLHVRSRGIMASELPGDAVNDLAALADPEKRRENNQFVYENRWKVLMEAVLELEAEILEAEVMWGNKIEASMKEVRRAVIDLNFALEDFIFHPLSQPASRTDITKIRHRFLGKLDGSDEISQQIRDALGPIEAKARQHLRR